MSADSSDDLSRLDDYASGEMPDAEAEEFETELFARAGRGEAPEAVFLDTLARSARWLGKRGSFEVGTTRARVDSLLASSTRTHFLDFGDGSVPIDIPPLPEGTQVFTYRLGVDLRGFDAADVVIETTSGEYVKTFRDVSYDPVEGALYGVCEAPLAEISFRRGPIRSRVLAKKGASATEVAVFETRPTGG